MSFISPELNKQFDQESLFKQVSALNGEVYREVEGRRTFRVLLNNKPYFAKVHYGIGWWEIIKNLLQLRMPVLGASNEWQAIQKLHDLNVDTLNAVAYSSEGSNPARMRSCIVTEALDDTTSLEDVVSQGKLTPELKSELVPRLAKISSTLHRNGVNHRDYYLCHFLLSNDSLTDNLVRKLHLIDLHRVQIRTGKAPSRWQEKDLAGLLFSAADAGVTRRDVYRFIAVYTGLPLRQALDERRAFWQRIVTRARKLYEKDQGRASQFLEFLDHLS
jgi:heptose I phosphotransferase